MKPLSTIFTEDFVFFDSVDTIVEVLIYGWEWLPIKECSFWGMVGLCILIGGVISGYKFSFLKNPNNDNNSK